MSRGGDTEAIVIPAVDCALCGDHETPGINVPVMGGDGRARMPRVCENCLAPLLGVVLQLAGHAPLRMARVVVDAQGGRTGLT